MITHFSSYTDKSQKTVPTATPSGVKPQSKDSGLGWLPTAGGIAGGLIGGALGTPADIVSGPAGTLVGGALGAGLGGATGKSVQNIIERLTGQGNSQTPLGNAGSAL